MLSLLIPILIANAAPPADFKVSVSIVKEGAGPLGGSIELKKNVCVLTNGPKARKAALKVCREIGEQILREQASYTLLPWINSPHVPSFVVFYKGASGSWTRETGVSPEPESKPREALRALAVRVLETAK